MEARGQYLRCIFAGGGGVLSLERSSPELKAIPGEGLSYKRLAAITQGSWVGSLTSEGAWALGLHRSLFNKYFVWSRQTSHRGEATCLGFFFLCHS